MADMMKVTVTLKFRQTWTVEATDEEKALDDAIHYSQSVIKEVEREHNSLKFCGCEWEFCK